MKTILIPVIDKIAKSPDEEIVCGNSDYYIEFAFDSEWDGYDVKTARFVYGGKKTDVVFKGNVVQVPVMSNTTKVFVGVFSGDLRTSTPAAIVCRPSILCKGGTPHDPTPDVYAQIMDMMNSAVSPTVSVDDVAGGHRITITDVSGTKTFDVMDGAKGEKGDTGATGAKGEKGDPYTLTEEDKEIIVADVLKEIPDGANIPVYDSLDEVPADLPEGTTVLVPSDGGNADETLEMAKDYADEKLAMAKAYTDETLETAKSYTDQNLATAKAYTDEKLASDDETLILKNVSNGGLLTLGILDLFSQGGGSGYLPNEFLDPIIEAFDGKNFVEIETGDLGYTIKCPVTAIRASDVGTTEQVSFTFMMDYYGKKKVTTILNAGITEGTNLDVLVESGDSGQGGSATPPLDLYAQVDVDGDIPTQIDAYKDSSCQDKLNGAEIDNAVAEGRSIRVIVEVFMGSMKYTDVFLTPLYIMYGDGVSAIVHTINPLAEGTFGTLAFACDYAQ